MLKHDTRAHAHRGSAYTEEELAEMLVDNYEEAMKYSNIIIWVICGGILVAGLIRLFNKFERTKLGARIGNNHTILRIKAATRYIGTRPTKSFTRYMHFPTRGVIFLISVFWVFVLVWTFAVQPYYRSRWNVGSPPLAIRTGMMALGIFPFILAFGAKWSLVTFVTGYSHEKLQVFHQWFSHLFYVLSLLHTFPFVMAGREARPNTDGLNPMGLSQIGYSWYVGKVYYWTGIAMLLPLTWLCYASLTPLRNRWYEMFKILHFISAILFSAFFYLHCNKLLTSWSYLYATAALYLLSVVMRFGLMLWRNGRGVSQGRIEVLQDQAVRLTITTPNHTWKAGQHVFVNFWKKRLFESHPYTISNIASHDSSNRQMVIVLKTNTRNGIGSRLVDLDSTPVLLDGPYGAGADLKRFDTVLLLAGGSGVSFVTAILQDVCEGFAQGKTRVGRIVMHWVVRREESRSWFSEQILACVNGLPEGMLELHCYVSGGADDVQNLNIKSEGSDVGVAEKETVGSSIASSTWIMTHNRPYLPALISEAFVAPGSVGIASCGPTSFTDNVRKAVAEKQKSMMMGRDVRELVLHTEEFDW